MPDLDSKTKEAAFEKELVQNLVQNGWVEGEPSKFDPSLAIYPEDLLGFIKDTQDQQYQEVKKYHNSKTDKKLVERVAKVMDKNGSLHVLRHGIKEVMGRFKLCQFKPSFGFNPDVVDRYRKNRLRVVRQVQFDPNSSRSLDLVFFVNGIPVATAELKTELTQGIQDAIHQYKKDRKPMDFQRRKIPLLEFKKRALVHFAVSTDEIWMTTHLKGKDTHFLPFNKGYKGGKGNPPNPNGYPVSYFWEEILQRDNWLDIVGRFLHLEQKQKDGEKIEQERLIFPRYHQWDCVTRLIEIAKKEGPGQNYLAQHSTGSGKSNEIAWLSHRLAGLHDDQDNKVFDSVIVVTDRRVLDSQLQDAIYQFDHQTGVVQNITEGSKQLAKALEDNIPIVVTTLQKFPVVLERIGLWGEIDRTKIGRGRYAIIVDEAHSSQGGKAASKLRQILGEGIDSEKEITAEEVINKIMESKGASYNISFFAFTATPKAKTLELFGRQNQAGEMVPFHKYSMKQAIEEGFIIDVLKNYVTYKTFVKLAKDNLENTEVEVSKAKKKLGKYVVLHPYNISQKIEVIVEHFREKIMHLLGGRAKAMVVTSSREEAARYKLAFDKYIHDQGYTDIKALVAFSGELNLPDVSPDKLTEYNMNPGLNGRSLEKALEEEYQIMLCADKFQTGFDQPLLCAMYVLKKLSGVAAVQTLGRLNRFYPGKDNQTCILDFVNEAQEIEEAFKPFYEDTKLTERTDPNVVHDLVDKLDEYQVYAESEVQGFAEIYFDPNRDISQGQLLPFLQPAKDRFQQLTEEEQKLFKKDLSSFVRAYDYLSMIVPYNDPELEKKCEYARRLNSYLKIKYEDEYISTENLQLSHYRLKKTGETKMDPTPQEGGGVLNPVSELGTGRVKSKKYDSILNIVEELNELFGGSNLTEDDKVYLFENVSNKILNSEIIKEQALNNTYEQFKAGDINSKLIDAVIDNMQNNQEMSLKILQDEETKNQFFDLMVQHVYEVINQVYVENNT